jgi:hypothetical protein
LIKCIQKEFLVLDYSVEGKEDEHQFDTAMKMTLKP